MAHTPARVIAIAAVIMGGCGESGPVITEIPCEQVDWAFGVTRSDGTPWRGRLVVGQEIRLSVHGLWRNPSPSPHSRSVVSRVCEDRIESVTWSSSNPAVIEVQPVSGRDAAATGRGPGTADVIASVEARGVPRQSSFLRVEVEP
jgi:hypothetical protein